MQFASIPETPPKPEEESLKPRFERLAETSKLAVDSQKLAEETLAADKEGAQNYPFKSDAIEEILKPIREEPTDTSES